MKKGGILLLAAATLGALLVSCSKGEDVTSQNEQVTETILQSTFATQFPTATKVSWSAEEGYQVATFTLATTTKSTTSSSHLCKAWYNSKGKWQMTVVDYTYDQLSDAIKKAFTATAYGDGSWAIVRVVKVTWADSTTAYKIEVSKSGESNHILYFKEDGTLKKDKKVKSEYGNCDEFPVSAPAEIQAYVTASYPNATIKEVMKGKWGYMVEILDGTVTRNLFFNTSYELQMAISDGTIASLPLAVQTAFNASTYATWTVRHVNGFEMKNITGKFYYIEVSNGSNRATLIYKEDGTLVLDLAAKFPF